MFRVLIVCFYLPLNPTFWVGRSGNSALSLSTNQCFHFFLIYGQMVAVFQFSVCRFLTPSSHWPTAAAGLIFCSYLFVCQSVSFFARRLSLVCLLVESHRRTIRRFWWCWSMHTHTHTLDSNAGKGRQKSNAKVKQSAPGYTRPQPPLQISLGRLLTFSVFSLFTFLSSCLNCCCCCCLLLTCRLRPCFSSHCQLLFFRVWHFFSHLSGGDKDKDKARGGLHLTGSPKPDEHQCPPRSAAAAAIGFAWHSWPSAAAGD